MRTGRLELMRLAAEYVIIKTWKGSWHPEDRWDGEDRMERIEGDVIWKQ